MSNTPTDEELIAELEVAGVAFMAFRGGAGLTKKIWTTSGSQDAKKIATGIRAVLAKWGTPQPVVREPQWIDPNDKTQQQYLPHIGEPVLFCHKGTTYYGKHMGGGFVSGIGFAQKHFNTWHCHWMYPPAAHGITQKGGA